MASEQEEWQLAAYASAVYQQRLVPAVTSIWARSLAARAELVPGERVLDAACGTGVVARVASAAVAGVGFVVGLDVNAGMLAVARAVPAAAALRPAYIRASVQAQPFADDTFDVVLCQLGLQFFPDPVRALQEMRRVLKTPGRLLLSVFGPIKHNPATDALATSLENWLGAGAATAKRQEHALADVDGLESLIAASGFGTVAVITEVRTVQFASVDDYVRVQLTGTPLASLLPPGAKQREALISAVTTDVALALSPYIRDDAFTFPQEIHAAVARP